MDLSILTVSFRCAEDTLRCFHSLENGGAEGLDWELLVGDNGSGDIERLGALKDVPRVRLFPSTENIGFGRENNRLAEAARGEYLLCLNPDTIVPRGTLKVLVDHLRTHPECGVCGPLLTNPDGSRQDSWGEPFGLAWEFCEAHYLQNWYRKRAWKRQLASLSPIWNVGFTSGACLCVSKQLWMRISGFCPKFFMNHEDVDFCDQVRNAGIEVHVLSPCCVIHAEGAAQRQNWRRYTFHRFQSKWLYHSRRFQGGKLFFVRLLWWESLAWKIVIGTLILRREGRTRLPGFFDAARWAITQQMDS